MKEKTSEAFIPSNLAESIIGSFNPNDHVDVTYIKAAAKVFIDEIDMSCPDGRRKSIAITHIEQAAMMAVKSLS